MWWWPYSFVKHAWGKDREQKVYISYNYYYCFLLSSCIISPSCRLHLSIYLSTYVIHTTFLTYYNNNIINGIIIGWRVKYGTTKKWVCIWTSSWEVAPASVPNASETSASPFVLPPNKTTVLGSCPITPSS